MNQNVYLQRLELAPGATPAEIKSAFRRLSKKYHPDINKSPDAEAEFIAIHEAYKFLTEVGPAPHQEPVAYDYDPYQQEYEERRRRAQRYAYRMAREARQRQEASIRYMLRIFDTLAYLIIGFNLLLAIDYFWPAHWVEKEVKAVNIVQEALRAGPKRYRYKDLELDAYRIRFNKRDWEGKVDDIVKVEETRLLHTPLSVTLMQNGNGLTLEPAYSIYVVFGYLIPAVFFIAMVYRFVFRSLDHKFTLAIVMTAVFAFQLYIFLKF